MMKSLSNNRKDRRHNDIGYSEHLINHSSPPMVSVSSSLEDNQKVDISSDEEDSSDNLECLSSIYPFQQQDKENNQNSKSEEAYFWSKLKESGNILEQLLQLQQSAVHSTPVDAEEETQSSASYEDNSYDFVEETKPFLISSSHYVVDEFQVEDFQDPNWVKLLRFLHPNATFPVGCIKFVIDHNLFSGSMIRGCFQLICCPLCNPNVVSEIDWSMLCHCLLYLFDRRISFTVEEESLSNITWKSVPEWIPSFQDFEKFMSHMGTITQTKETMESAKERFQKPTFSILSIWKRVLSCMAACIPVITCSPAFGGYGRLEDIVKVIQVMTRILLDPFGKHIRGQACWVLYRCWIVLGGSCQQLTCLVNEYFTSVFLKYATSITLQLQLLESLDSSLQQLSQYFAYKLFILYTKGEENLFYSLSEKIEYQVGNFLLSFLKENLVYGADVQLVKNGQVKAVGQFQRFVYPLIFEMKDASSIIHRVDMLSSEWQFCENSWSEHEASHFHMSHVEPHSLVKYHFKESFQPCEFVCLMEELCQRNCESISIIVRFALLAIQPSLLFQMESQQRERLLYAISTLKSASTGLINSCKVAIYLGHLHMIAECLCHSIETSHSGVVREQQLTLRKWFHDEDA
ncbi:hypothetical protein GpartN1_g1061.t1 [Galdieria partita]|uniref:Uncharacterized protein n=1 Tax=Galdieria partita TaxID=83374 RepID=A0A9C7PRQ2_9RHOD|nr:hypothetical protein GpartN1_g1061.t1 [Galdieria partita]